MLSKSNQKKIIILTNLMQEKLGMLVLMRMEKNAGVEIIRHADNLIGAGIENRSTAKFSKKKISTRNLWNFI